jgi:hypothetical protein
VAAPDVILSRARELCLLDGRGITAGLDPIGEQRIAVTLQVPDGTPIPWSDLQPLIRQIENIEGVSSVFIEIARTD